MANITSAIRDTISISLFNRGLAGKIFEDVKQSGAKVVMKNNSAECVLLSPDEYVKLMDEVNDARLLSIANERMQNFNPANLISSEELYNELGITEEDLDASKKALEDAFKSVSDSPEALDSWFTTQIEHSEYLYPEDYINIFKDVTKEDVIRAANDVTLDTVFMLEGVAEGGVEE